MRYVLVVLAALFMASPTFAEEYEKGPNGGLMLDVAGIDAELLTSGSTVTINVFEPFKPNPVSTKGYTAAVLIVSGASREPLTLTPSGENSLQGDAKRPIRPTRRSRSRSRRPRASLARSNSRNSETCETAPVAIGIIVLGTTSIGGALFLVSPHFRQDICFMRLQPDVRNTLRSHKRSIQVRGRFRRSRRAFTSGSERRGNLTGYQCGVRCAASYQKSLLLSIGTMIEAAGFRIDRTETAAITFEIVSLK